MTNKSISQLNAGAAVTSTDLFPDVQTVGVGPVKVTAAQVGNYVLTGSGMNGAMTLGTAGSVAGTLGLSGSTSGVVTIQTAATAGTWSLTLPNSGGTNGYILTTNGSGVTSWTNPTALGIDLDVGSTAITNGTNGRVLYDNNGTLGEYSSVPVSFGGTGLTTLTAGYIPFGNGTGAFGSNGNLFWDSVNSRFGLYTNAPSTNFHISIGDATIRIGLDTSSQYMDIKRNTSDGYFEYNAAQASPYRGHKFLLGGSEAMRIDSSGNVGIGCVPSNLFQVYRNNTGQGAQIQIEQAGSGSATLGFLRTGVYAWLTGHYSGDNSYRIAASGADLNTNARFVIDTSGNVGIGTSSPASALNVIGTGTFGQLYGSVGSLTVFQNTATNYILKWSRTDNTGIGGIAVADTSGSVAFYTDNGSTGYERMRIVGSSGNVGIGTSSPATKLHVYGDWVSNTGQLTIDNSGTQYSGLTFKNNGNYKFLAYNDNGSAVTFITTASGTNQPLILGTNEAERLRIDSSGNVGIGTSSPSGRLHCAASSDILGIFESTSTGAAQFRLAASSASTAAWNAISSMYGATEGWYIGGRGNTNTLTFATGGSECMRIDSSGNVVVNTAAIATNATDGFLYVPTCAGTPTGTPTTYTGRSPIVVDSTNNRIYFYSGGAWRNAGP